jgi:uncharacterized protein YbjT (DUF2867 family)
MTGSEETTDLSSPNNPRILLTGATGYIGGRLLNALVERHYNVRCLARHPQYLAARVNPAVEIVKGDLLDSISLTAALQGIDTAYYLVHSMASGGSFESQDRTAAQNFADAAKQAGLRRIVYLGGLGEGDDLSAHLRSRQEVGEVLRASGVPTIEFRASIVLGSGSLSFEIIRALTDRLPVMVTPKWVRVKAQPIGIEDVITYLVAALDLPAQESQVFEIGGRDRASYQEIMREYARQRGLKRWMIPVPVLTPRLSSLWLGLVTPVYARVGRKLIASIKNESTADTVAALAAFTIRPIGMREAIQRAGVNEDREFAETRWSESSSSFGEAEPFGGRQFGSRLVDSRAITLSCPADAAFRIIEGIGAKRGWQYGDWLWRLRGFADLLVGGPGLRRGRRVPHRLRVGDALDFWRVEAVERPRLLRLRAEMKLPGRAWLQFEVDSAGPERCTVRQTAMFDPVGLAGLAYWYGLFVIHNQIFHGMLRKIGRLAEVTYRRDVSRETLGPRQ